MDVVNVFVTTHLHSCLVRVWCLKSYSAGRSPWTLDSSRVLKMPKSSQAIFLYTPPTERHLLFVLLQGGMALWNVASFDLLAFFHCPNLNKALPSSHVLCTMVHVTSRQLQKMCCESDFTPAQGFLVVGLGGSLLGEWDETHRVPQSQSPSLQLCLLQPTNTDVVPISHYVTNSQACQCTSIAASPDGQFVAAGFTTGVVVSDP